MANSVQKLPKNINVETSQTLYSSTTSDPPGAEINQPKSKTPRKKVLSPFYQGLLWGATFSLTAAVSAIIGASVALVSPLSVKLPPIIEKAGLYLSNTTSTKNNQGLDSVIPYRLSRPVNILVMGIDRVPDAKKGSLEVFRGRSDTMLLLRFDPSDNSVRMLSIPRDSRVEIPGVGYEKVNDANVHGGPALAARVVSKTLNNVPIDRYVRVTTDAFIELVDLVGGVEVFVPTTMSYKDVTQKLDINLQAGWQTLNGEQAEQFARFRSDKYGDIGRVQRQQVLLKALEKRIYSPAMIARIPQAIQILQQYIDTNLSFEEMLALANFGQDLQRENLKMVMLPGRFSREGEYDERSYWILYPHSRDRVMQEYFGVVSGVSQTTDQTSLSQVRIAIENASDEPGLADRVAQYLQQQNFNHVYVTKDSPQLLRETEIVVQKGNLTAADNLQKFLGVGRVEASSTGDLDSELTLRVGLDAKQLLEGNSFVKGDSK